MNVVKNRDNEDNGKISDINDNSFPKWIPEWMIREYRYYNVLQPKNR